MINMLKNIYLGNRRVGDIPKQTLALALKRINNAYVGNCLKLRRSGDNAELECSFDGSGNIDVISVQNWTNDGGGTQKCYIIVWYDQSGYGNNAIQFNNANQPELNLSSIPKIIFSVCNSTFLEIPNNKTLQVDNYDFSLVMKTLLTGYNSQGSSINVPLIKVSGQYAATSYGFVMDEYNNMYFKTGAGKGTANVSITTGETKTFIGIRSGLDAKFYEDKNIVAIGADQNQSSSNNSSLFIGRDGLTALRFIDMELISVMLFKDYALNDRDINLIEGL